MYKLIHQPNAVLESLYLMICDVLILIFPIFIVWSI